MEENKRIYLAGPLGINPHECKRTVLQIAEYLINLFPGYEFFIPHVEIGITVDADGNILGNKEALIECYIELSRCDELWVIGPPEISAGTRSEIAVAEAFPRPWHDKYAYLWEKYNGPK